ncbi:unnamed protein product, partial [Polarella glacialis]
ARSLAKGLHTGNVVQRLVTCEEFGLGKLREKILERLTQNPSEMAMVSRCPEIMQHPKILQDLLVYVANNKNNVQAQQQAQEQTDDSEMEKSAARSETSRKPDESEKPEKPEKPEKSEKPEKQQRAKREEKPAQPEKEQPKAKRARKGFVGRSLLGCAACLLAGHGGLLTVPGAVKRPTDVRWRAISYNAQAFTYARGLQDVLHELHSGNIIGIQGRGGAIRFRRNGFCDITAMVLYLSPGNAAAYNEKLLAWANQIISTVPGRTLPLIMLDGNAHVGLERNGRQVIHHADNDAAGSQRPSLQNANGRLLRHFCNTQYLWHDYYERDRQRYVDEYWQKISEEVCNQAYKLYPAYEDRDMKRVWRIARAIAGKHLGPKKRQYGIATGFIPPVEEWAEHLAQPGPKGGCEAQLLRITEEAEIDVPTFCLLQDNEQDQSLDFLQPPELENLETQRVMTALRSTKAHREVPRWSAPREAWLSALSCESDDDNIEGNGEVTLLLLLSSLLCMILLSQDGTGELGPKGYTPMTVIKRYRKLMIQSECLNLIQGNLSEEFKKLAAANAKLSMHLASKSRLHDAALLRTVLLPKSHPVAEAMSAAGSDFNKRQKLGELAGIPPHLYICRAAIIAAMAVEQVTLSVSNEMLITLDSLIRVLFASGGELKLGALAVASAHAIYVPWVFAKHLCHRLCVSRMGPVAKISWWQPQKLVTNSATRILGLAKPGSPVAKVLLAHVRRSAEDLGDGAGTLVLLLEGAIGFCAASLKEGKARRQELERCFAFIEARLLATAAAPLLARLSRPAGFSTEEAVQGLAFGFFGANFPPEVSRHLGRSCWTWLRANATAAGGDAEASGTLAATASRLCSGTLVKVPATKLAGAYEPLSAGTCSSTVERAHLVSGVLAHSTMTSSVQGVCLAVVLDESTAALPVRVTVPGAALERLSELLLLSVERFWQAGIRVLLCAGEVHEEWRGAMARRGLLLLHLVEDDELELLERGRAALGGAQRVRLATDDLPALKKAAFQLAAARPLQPQTADQLASGRAFWVLQPGSGEPMPHCWLLLRAPSVGLAVEHRAALLRLLRVIGPALQDPSVVIAGGLAFELGLLRLARKHGAVAAALPPEELASVKEVFGVEDEVRAARLWRLSWSMLEAALLRVLEAFLANLMASDENQGAGGDQRLPPPKARRLARLLATAAPEELAGAAPGLCKLPWPPADTGGPMFGFVASPGLGEVAAAMPPLETASLKLELLRAFCGLGRLLCRLDPATVQGRGLAPAPAAPATGRPQARMFSTPMRSSRRGSDSESESAGEGEEQRRQDALAREQKGARSRVAASSGGAAAGERGPSSASDAQVLGAAAGHAFVA